MMIPRLIICFFSIVLTAVMTTVTAAESIEPIVFCLDADNAPFSKRSNNITINTEIVDAIAEKLQRPLQIQWIDVPMRGGLSRAVKESLNSDVCDAFLGVPVEAGMSAELTKANVSMTSAYLSVGYVAVSSKSSVVEIDNNSTETLRFGASSATPADLFLLHNKLERIAYASNQELLVALRRNIIDVALIWSPTLINVVDEFDIHHELINDLQFVDPLKWDISMAVKLQEGDLLSELNDAIQYLIADGHLSRLTKAKGLVQL